MMSQFSTSGPLRRTGGDLNVYTGLLCVAFLVLAVGVILLMKRNVGHSGQDNAPGGAFKLVGVR